MMTAAIAMTIKTFRLMLGSVRELTGSNIRKDVRAVGFDLWARISVAAYAPWTAPVTRTNSMESP
jgi:hypothetical protein